MRRGPCERRTRTRAHPRIECPRCLTGQRTSTSPMASVRPSLRTRNSPRVSTKQWQRTHQPQPCQSCTALATFPPSPPVQKILGPHSAATTITTIAPSHRAASQSPITPHDTPGPMPTTATATFVLHIRHHLALTHHNCPRQSRPSKQSATHKKSHP